MDGLLRDLRIPFVVHVGTTALLDQAYRVVNDAEVETALENPFALNKER